MQNQRYIGTIVILPDLESNQKGPNNHPLVVENHYLHNFGKEDISKAKIYEDKEDKKIILRNLFLKTKQLIPHYFLAGKIR